MAEQTSRLAVIIDSSGAQKNTETLASSLAKLTQAGQKAADGAGKVTKATEDEAQAISDLKKAIDPVGSAIDTLGKRFTQLKNFYGKGLIDQEEFTFLSQKINQTTEELSGVAQAQRDAEKAGKAAEAQQQAQAQAFQRMLDKIDPLSSALKNLDQQQSELSNALSSGKINTNQYDAYTQKLNETRREINGEAQAERDAIKAHDAQAASLQRLVAQLDPVGEAFRRLAQQQNQLDDAKSSGLLSLEAYTSLSSSVSTARGELEKTQQQLLKTGQSAKQTAFAMRMIPAQMTDIVVGLSTGQSPFMVLMQQGGQLKDMFGGIGPAIKGTASYALGLVNPFTLGAAAVAGLGLAYYQGQQEQEAFQQSLILTGNQVGKTAGQLSDMARNVSLATGSTQGAAAGVLNQLVSAGNIAGDSLQKVAGSIVNMSSVTGQATTQMVSDFESIAENPVQAISKLNDQYHFLTLATYNQIKALADEGNQQDAARVATDAYANAINSRANDIGENLNALGKTWNWLGNQAKSAWDAMEGIGREGSIQDRIADIQKQIADIQSNSKPGAFGLGGIGDGGYQDKKLAALKSQLVILQGQAATETVLNDSISKHDQQQQDGIKAQQFINNLQDQSLSNAQKRTKEQNQLTEALKKTRAAGISISASEEATLRQNIDDKYKDPKQPKQKAYSEDAGTRLIDQLNQQHASLTAQLDTSTKIGASQQALIKWEQQLADIKSKHTLTADQKSLLANQDKITALYQQNAAIEKGREIQEQQQKITAFNNQLLKESAQYADQLNSKLVGAGLGSKEQQRAQELLSLRQQANQKQSDLTDRFNDKSTGMTPETYKKETDMINQDLARRTGYLKQYYVQADAMESNWQAGVMSSLHNFVDQNSDYMTMASQATSDILNGLSSSISDNFTSILNGTESFKKGMSSLVSELGQDVIKTLIHMATQALITKAIIGIGGSLFSGGAAAGNAGTAISGGGSSLSLGANIPSFAGGLTGMAHSGIDSVPNTGTWLLEKGERVMTSQTSARLDSTLDHIKRNGLDATLSRSGFGTGTKTINNTTNSQPNIAIHAAPITIQGNPDDRTIALIQASQKQAISQSYKMISGDLAAGKGQVHKSLISGYNTSRRTG